MRFIESCNETVTRLLSALLTRDRNTPIKRSQHSYQEIAAPLSTNYSAPVKRSQHSCQEITPLLSRNRSTLIKRSQHSYQEISALLSRNHSTLIKRLQQNVTKMIEYLNFFPLCTLLALMFYLYIRTKKYINLLKMAEENVNFIFSSYETHS